MLIRSQNKKNLINLAQATNIAIISREGRFKIMAYYQVEDGYDCMGEYSTEAKAIKVLDAIENAYRNVESNYKVADDTYWQSIRDTCLVFQLPQDGEV